MSKTAPDRPRPLFRRWPMRDWFTLIVLAALATGWLVTALRPDENWPVFSPPPDVDFEPLDAAPPARQLAGRVARPDGTPAADVFVEVLAGGYPYWAWTRGDGRFTLSGLPAPRPASAPGAAPDELEAVLLAPGHPPTLRTLADWDGMSQVAWTLAPPLREPVALVPMERSRCTGRLLISIGAATTGYEIVVVPTGADPDTRVVSGVAPRRTQTNLSGEFEFPDLAHGDYELSVLPPWAAGGSWPVLASVAVSHGAEQQLAPITLQAGRIAVHAVDSAGGKVGGALLLLWPETHPSRIWPPKETSSKGGASIGDLPPGRYTVELRAGAARAQDTVELGPGELSTLTFDGLVL